MDTNHKIKITITCERKTSMKDIINRSTYEHFLQVFDLGYTCLNVQIERIDEEGPYLPERPSSPSPTPPVGINELR